MTVRVLPVTAADVIPLEAVYVTDAQDPFIAPNPVTIAQVRFRNGAYDFCIWDGDTRVGLIAVIDNAESDPEDLDDIDHPEAVYIWRLLIGAEHQKRGYGTAAIGFAEDWARQRGRSLMQIQSVETNTVALALYQRLGYRLTGQKMGNELQLEKPL